MSNSVLKKISIIIYILLLLGLFFVLRHYISKRNGVSYESLEKTHFVIGQFKAWEEIKDSEDRYILLTNPETGRSYPRIRICSELDNIYSNEGWDGITSFYVEKNGTEYDGLGYFRDFALEEIDKLIGKGDFIKIIFEKKNINEKTDSNYLALHIFIKRDGGKAEIEQELGKEVQEP
jgi:hypothetical protein